MVAVSCYEVGDELCQPTSTCDCNSHRWHHHPYVGAEIEVVVNNISNGASLLAVHRPNSRGRAQSSHASDEMTPLWLIHALKKAVSLQDVIRTMPVFQEDQHSGLIGPQFEPMMKREEKSRDRCYRCHATMVAR